MPLPRQPCPECGRSTAVMLRAGDPHRLYRHDPPTRPIGNLVSCPGSLTLVTPGPDARQPALFGDTLLATLAGPDNDGEDGALF